MAFTIEPDEVLAHARQINADTSGWDNRGQRIVRMAVTELTARILYPELSVESAYRTAWQRLWGATPAEARKAWTQDKSEDHRAQYEGSR